MSLLGLYPLGPMLRPNSDAKSGRRVKQIKNKQRKCIETTSYNNKYLNSQKMHLVSILRILGMPLHARRCHSKDTHPRTGRADHRRDQGTRPPDPEQGTGEDPTDARGSHTQRNTSDQPELIVQAGAATRSDHHPHDDRTGAAVRLIHSPHTPDGTRSGRTICRPGWGVSMVGHPELTSPRSAWLHCDLVSPMPGADHDQQGVSECQ